MVRITRLFLGASFLTRISLGGPMPISATSQIAANSDDVQSNIRPTLAPRGEVKSRLGNGDACKASDVSTVFCGPSSICSFDNTRPTVECIPIHRDDRHIGTVVTQTRELNATQSYVVVKEVVTTGIISGPSTGQPESFTSESIIGIAVGVPAAIASIIGAWASIIALRRPRNFIQRLFRCG
ncbi:hypothetical protein M434DRAFT_32648 [Hypoxylon sp. CO27-5]|nr:hypothetical protein M434DRAFT_32648 [Hypoxylon sp. CO27-5]